MDNEINEDEIFEKKESKFKISKTIKNKKFISIFAIILIIVILSVVEFLTGSISGIILPNKMGNTNGNIANCGYSVSYKGYIYYVAPGDDMQNINIYKAKLGETNSEKIYDGDYDIRGLNIVGNKLYFISISSKDAKDGDQINNQICKMNLDGSNFEVINDNDFSYDYDDIYVIKNRIYYVGEDYNIYKMNLNGGQRELVAKTGTGFLAMNEKYIIYNKEKEDGSDYIPYISKIDGTNEREFKSERIYTPVFYEKNVYYINENQHLAKMSIKGGDEQELTDYTVNMMNLAKGYIYFLNYKDEENEDYTVSIYRVSVDGGEAEEVKALSNYASFLNIVDDYLYYMDMDNEQAFINLVNINDKNETRLYNWKYSDFDQTGNAEQKLETVESTEETEKVEK